MYWDADADADADADIDVDCRRNMVAMIKTLLVDVVVVVEVRIDLRPED